MKLRISKFIKLKQIDTTMKYIENYFSVGEDEALAIVAEEQTGGFGRKGRRWMSPKGGLYMTIIKSPEVEPHLYQAIAPLSVIRSVYKQTNLLLSIKWPNDIYTPGLDKKVGGILLNLQERGKSTRIAIGIGINVNNEPPHTEYPTESLKNLMGKPIGIDELACSILWELFFIESKTKSQEIDLLQEYRRYTPLEGRLVRVVETNEVLKVIGIDDDLSLLVINPSTDELKKLKDQTIRLV